MFLISLYATFEKDADGNPLGVVSHDYDWSYAEFQTIVLEESLAPGANYTLTMPYSGSMVTYPAGLWYGGYSGDNGVESVHYL